MDILMERFQERQNRRKRNPETLKNSLRAFRSFQGFLDETKKTADQVTPEEVEGYFFNLFENYSHHVCRMYRNYLNAAFAYGLNRGDVRRNPLVDLELPREPDREPHTFTSEELRRILAQVRTVREAAAFHLFVYGGLRRAEVANLLWSNVDFETNTLTVTGKYSKIRKVPVHPALHDVLQFHRERNPDGIWVIQNFDKPKPLCVDQVAQTFRWRSRGGIGLIDRAGIAEGSCHSFRRTLATSLDENGARESDVDAIFGWAPSSVRGRHYVRIAPERLQRAILKAYANDPIS